VNGINAVLDKGNIKTFLTLNQPSVLCLNETKASIEALDKKSIASRIEPGYAQYWNCCTVKKGYSGTAIFTKVKPLSVRFDFGTKHN